MGNDAFEGYGVELIQGISELLSKIMLNLALIWDFVTKNIIFKGFNYTLKWVDDGAYGSKSKETGEWNGMLGEILENVRSPKYFQQYLFN